MYRRWQSYSYTRRAVIVAAIAVVLCLVAVVVVVSLPDVAAGQIEISTIPGGVSAEAPSGRVFENGQLVAADSWRAHGPGAEITKAELKSDGQTLSLTIVTSSPLPEVPFPMDATSGTFSIILLFNFWNDGDFGSSRGITVSSGGAVEDWEVSAASASENQTLTVKPTVSGTTLHLDVPLENLPGIRPPFRFQIFSMWTTFVEGHTPIAFQSYFPGLEIGLEYPAVLFPGTASPTTAGSSSTSLGASVATSPATLQATSPTTAASTVSIPTNSSLTIEAPTSTTMPSTSDTAFQTTTTVAVPSVSSISPKSGPRDGGGTVTIRGSALGGVTEVRFGPVSASFTVVSDSKIQAIAPACFAPSGYGPVDVTVVSYEGTSAVSNADVYTYVPPPVPSISSVSPKSGPYSGGNIVTIYGIGFSEATEVRFGPWSASFKVVSDSRIQATAPLAPTSSGGPVHITVASDTDANATTAADIYTYQAETPQSTS